MFLYLQRSHCSLCIVLILSQLTRSLSLWPGGVGTSWLCRHPGRGPSEGPRPRPACLISQPGAGRADLSCHFQRPGGRR